MAPKIDRLDHSKVYGRPKYGAGGGDTSGIIDGPHRRITLEVSIYQEPSRYFQGQGWVAPDAEEIAMTLDAWLKFALKDDWFVAWVSNTTVEDDQTPWEVLYQGEGDEEPSFFYGAANKTDALEYIERHQGGVMGRLSARPA
jgi:hypothetical protein